MNSSNVKWIVKITLHPNLDLFENIPPPLIIHPLLLATCTDGIKNQDEEAVDCGGKCAACGKFYKEFAIKNKK